MKFSYRPEIDGLRTIAVLSVIVYHLDLNNIFEGGYLGVDVFFVISGFLISAIILKELETTGTFSFINFYKRRIRRLLPVYFVVILITMIGAWCILYPTQLITFAKSGISSNLFFSNFYFLFSSQVYESHSSLLKPLLHTWTLSIEEQFYLVFPALLFFLFRYANKNLLANVMGFTVVSLIFSELYLLVDKSFTFYLLPTRFWEFSAGGLLAILNQKQMKPSFAYTMTRKLPSIGFFVLIGCFYYFDHNINHPGLFTVLPVIATMLIIYFANQEDFIVKLLSSKPFVYTGLLSYSLYLWHFPIFALGRNIRPQQNFVDYGLWILLSFLLAFVSFNFIEQPFRNKNKVGSRIFNLTVGSLFLISMIGFTLMVVNKGYPERYSEKVNLHLGNEIDNKLLRDIRNQYYGSAIEDADFRNDRTNVLIIGDSHSVDLFLAFNLNQELFNKYSFNRINYGSYEIKNYSQFDRISLIDEADVVILSYRYSQKPDLLGSMIEFINYLKDKGKRVVISSNNAEFSSFGRDEVFDQYIKEFSPTFENVDYDHMKAYFYTKRNTEITKINKDILEFAETISIDYLDRYSLVCDDLNRECECMTDLVRKAYTDNNHWSLEGAEYFGLKLSKRGFLSKMKPQKSKELQVNTSDKQLNIVIKDRLLEEVKFIDERLASTSMSENQKDILLMKRTRILTEVEKIKNRL